MFVTRAIKIGVLVALGTLGLSACGDDDSDDGSSDDNGTVPDAGGGSDSGGQPDGGGGGGATHASTSLLIQLQVLLDGFAPQGFFIESTFQAKSDLLPPSYAQMPGSPFGCVVFEKTADYYLPGSQEIEDGHVATGLDEGAMQISVSGGSPEFPACEYVADEGYQCVSQSGTGGDIEVVDAAESLYSITDPSITFGDAEVGRFVNITGAANPANNGQFPIVNLPPGPGNTIVYLNPQQDPVACGTAPEDCEEIGTSASYKSLAALPGGSTPRVADDAEITVEHTAGGDGHTADFSKSTDIGDSFTLAADSQELINNIPMDGSSFTIGCNPDGTDCGNAMASLLVVLTTDAPPPPGPPVLMPIPLKKAVQLQCIFLTPTVTVPPEAAAFLAGSGATRVRTTFGRVNPLNFSAGATDFTVIVGNAQVGVTQVAQ
jgi:hypothetical protein